MDEVRRCPQHRASWLSVSGPARTLPAMRIDLTIRCGDGTDHDVAIIAADDTRLEAVAAALAASCPAPSRAGAALAGCGRTRCSAAPTCAPAPPYGRPGRPNRSAIRPAPRDRRWPQCGHRDTASRGGGDRRPVAGLRFDDRRSARLSPACRVHGGTFRDHRARRRIDARHDRRRALSDRCRGDRKRQHRAHRRDVSGGGRTAEPLAATAAPTRRHDSGVPKTGACPAATGSGDRRARAAAGGSAAAQILGGDRRARARRRRSRDHAAFGAVSRLRRSWAARPHGLRRRRADRHPAAHQASARRISLADAPSPSRHRRCPGRRGRVAPIRAARSRDGFADRDIAGGAAVASFARRSGPAPPPARAG